MARQKGACLRLRIREQDAMARQKGVCLRLRIREQDECSEILLS